MMSRVILSKAKNLIFEIFNSKCRFPDGIGIFYASKCRQTFL